MPCVSHQVHQHMHQAFRQGARAEHLRQRRIAARLERQGIEQLQRQIGNLARELAQSLARQTEHRRALRGDRRPHAGSAEDMRTADEISGQPIGERDLAAGRRGVEASDQPALDHDDAVLKLALREQNVRPVELPHGADAAHALAIVRRQPIDQAMRPSDQAAVLGKQHAGGAGTGRAIAIGSGEIAGSCGGGCHKLTMDVAGTGARSRQSYHTSAANKHRRRAKSTGFFRMMSRVEPKGQNFI